MSDRGIDLLVFGSAFLFVMVLAAGLLPPENPDAQKCIDNGGIPVVGVRNKIECVHHFNEDWR